MHTYIHIYEYKYILNIHSTLYSHDPTVVLRPLGVWINSYIYIYTHTHAYIHIYEYKYILNIYSTLYSHEPTVVLRPLGVWITSSEKKRPRAMTKPPST